MSAEIVARMAAAFRPDEICATKIRESVKLAESPSVELDVFRHAPGSKGAQDYQSLTDELVAAGFVE
jgi:chromosome partitioning protein